MRRQQKPMIKEFSLRSVLDDYGIDELVQILKQQRCLVSNMDRATADQSMFYIFPEPKPESRTESSIDKLVQPNAIDMIKLFRSFWPQDEEQKTSARTIKNDDILKILDAISQPWTREEKQNSIVRGSAATKVERDLNDTFNELLNNVATQQRYSHIGIHLIDALNQSKRAHHKQQVIDIAKHACIANNVALIGYMQQHSIALYETISKDASHLESHKPAFHQLIKAIQDNNVAMVKYILQPKSNGEFDLNFSAHTNDERENALQICLSLKDRDPEIIDYLIALTNNLNYQQDTKKNTALMRACISGDTRTIKQLMRHHTVRKQLTLQNSDGDTALHLAIQHNQLDCVKELLSSDYNIFGNFTGDLLRIRNNNGETPLHACLNSNLSNRTAMLEHLFALPDIGVILLYAVNSNNETLWNSACRLDDTDKQAQEIRHLIFANAHPSIVGIRDSNDKLGESYLSDHNERNSYLTIDANLFAENKIPPRENTDFNRERAYALKIIQGYTEHTGDSAYMRIALERLYEEIMTIPNTGNFDEDMTALVNIIKSVCKQGYVDRQRNTYRIIRSDALNDLKKHHFFKAMLGSVQTNKWGDRIGRAIVGVFKKQPQQIISTINPEPIPAPVNGGGGGGSNGVINGGGSGDPVSYPGLPVEAKASAPPLPLHDKKPSSSPVVNGNEIMSDTVPSFIGPAQPPTGTVTLPAQPPQTIQRQNGQSDLHNDHDEVKQPPVDTNSSQPSTIPKTKANDDFDASILPSVPNQSIVDGMPNVPTQSIHLSRPPEPVAVAYGTEDNPTHQPQNHVTTPTRCEQKKAASLQAEQPLESMSQQQLITIIKQYGRAISQLGAESTVLHREIASLTAENKKLSADYDRRQEEQKREHDRAAERRDATAMTRTISTQTGPAAQTTKPHSKLLTPSNFERKATAAKPPSGLLTPKSFMRQEHKGKVQASKDQAATYGMV